MVRSYNVNTGFTNPVRFGANGATWLGFKGGTLVLDLDGSDDVIKRKLNSLHLCVLSVIPRHRGR